MFVVVVVAALLVAQGEGEGEGDTGCVPACVGDVLHFCDFDSDAVLDCAGLDPAEGETCALLSAEWGFDCLLQNGAACDPGYGFGASRCQSASCIDALCSAEPPVDEPVLQPTPGTSFDAGTAATTASCLSCPQTSMIAPLSLLWLVRGLRRLRPRFGLKAPRLVDSPDAD